ncbi:MAG: class I SAM-dependent rRNA methyltransferase [Geminicoccaceae bacterium]|nr:MAG: class I SAM-dependent rRNA methyltransferase [Geminicoccaceae bacterium]
MNMTELPRLVLKSGHERRLRAGSPWVFANEVQMTDEVKALPPGSLVKLALPAGRLYGVAQVNPHSLIVARLLTRNHETAIDTGFFERRIGRALALRTALVDPRFCRLVHGEGDFLPGLTVDRFGDVVVVQPNTAGMDRSLDDVLSALERLLAPQGIVVRLDSHGRQLEGLASLPPRIEGTVDVPLAVDEAGVTFLADPIGGQKTGWFFDQRPNRDLVAKLAPGRRVLDLFSYAGGFALRAAAAGALHVHAIDRAAPALDLLRASAAQNGLAGKVEISKGDVLESLGKLTAAKARFDVVIADPPPYAPAKKDVPVALKGYRKLARAAAGVVAQDGFLAIASCSHHVDHDALLQATFAGLREAGRGARLLATGGAGPDHPIHPALPETRYLTFFLFALD